MNEIYLLRHGETLWNKKRICQGRIDNPLDDKGKNDALRLGKILLNNRYSFDYYISSPLSRAYETCKIIKQELKDDKKIIINKDFIERDFGILDGKPYSIAIPLVNSSKDVKIKNFEYNEDLISRVYKALLKLNGTYRNSKILISTHSNTIKAILIYLNPEKYTFLTSIPNLNLTHLEIDENNKVTLKEFSLFPLGLEDTTII